MVLSMADLKTSPFGFMIKNYLTIALRGLRRSPGYALINVLGLSVGIACCLLLFLHIQDELTADAFNARADRIYRLVETRSLPDEGDRLFASTAAPVAPALDESVPEVEATARVLRLFRPSVHRGAEGFYESEYFVTEPSFLQLFDFQAISGDAAAALSNPGQVVLTQSAVTKYFGDEDPIGQTLSVSGMGDMVVTAILRDPPRNSHLDFSMLIPMATLASEMNGWSEFVADWHPGYRRFATYVLLRKGATSSGVEAKLSSLFEAHRDDQNVQPQSVSLQPLRSIYFGSDAIEAPFAVRHGERSYLMIFGIISLFILVIACINYMNLATARSMRRSKEVGLRKAIGALRSQLVAQFLSEAVLTTIAALAIAIALVIAALPAFNGLVGKELVVDRLLSGPMIAALVFLIVLVGIAAGSYPALFLARFRPAQVLKGSASSSGHVGSLRRGLVVAQFTLSIGMIIGTFIAADQLQFLRNKNLGFDETQKLVFDINSGAVRRNAEIIRNSFLENPAVKNVSVSSRVPGDCKDINQIAVAPEASMEARTATFIGADASFLSTFDMNLVDGRDFDRERTADSAAVLLNETAVRAFGWADPIGRRIRVLDESMGDVNPDVVFEATVIGVVRDFNFKSLHEPITPMILGWISTPITGSDYITASVAAADLANTVASLSAIVRDIDPSAPVESNFLDQRIQEFYAQDVRVGRLFNVAAALAILVACLGLFGLAAYTAEQRTKEIGVRKVLGASVGGIVALMTADFLKPVGLAFLLATPLAYFGMHRWLEAFAYRDSMRISTFVLAGVVAIFVSLLTVGYQSIVAALANPVRSLRNE